MFRCRTTVVLFLLMISAHALGQIAIPAGFPNANNTGHSGSLTLHSGTYTATTQGETIENLRITGGVVIQADNVTVRNCHITGGLYKFRATNGNTGILVEDCTIDGEGDDQTTVRGANFIMRRCDISGDEDGVHPLGNVTIEDCYIHDLTYTALSHNDGMQFRDGEDVVIRHNTIQCGYQNQTSALLLQAETGPIDNVLIEDNFLSGGSYILYLRNREYNVTNVTVRGNVFEYDSWGFGPLSVDSGTGTFECNTYHTGDFLSVNDECTVNHTPFANAGPDQTVDGGAVTLNGTLSYDRHGTITSYVWEENSSQIATGSNPTVSLSVGSHSIDLTVTDDGSATDTDSVLIVVTSGGGNQPPTADAGSDQTVTDSDDSGSESVTLDGSGSSDSDGTIVSYLWEENSSQIATGSGPSVSFAVGAHTVELTVTDDDSATDTDTVVITVNAPGGGDTYELDCLTADQVVCDNGTFIWGGQETHRIGGGEAGKDGAAVLVFQLPTLDAGETVTDANLFVHMLVVGGALVSNADLYGLPYRTSSSVLTTDYYEGAYDGDANATALVNDFATPSTSTGTLETDASGDAALAAYIAAQYTAGAEGGDYVFIRLNPDIADVADYVYHEIASAEYATAAYRPVLTLITGGTSNAAPTADAGSDQTVTDNDDSGAENVTLDGSGSADSDGTIVSYVWEENSSQIATGSGPTVSFAVGAHTVELTVTDDDSATDTDTVVITVNAYVNQAPTADAGSDQTVTDSDDSGAENVTLDGSGSSDSDGTIVSYVWEENSSQIATGSGPTVSFTVGAHTVDLTVTDDDSATDTDSVVITVDAAPSGGETSNATWQTFALGSTETGVFTVEFDAVPNNANMDGATGVCLGTASAWSDLACIVRFYTSGNIDVRDGGSYAADTTLAYSAGTSYHVRMVIDVPNDTYSVYVTPQGGSETTLASDYGFRTDQVGVGSLDSWAIKADSGSHTVSNVTVGGPPNNAPTADAGSDQTVNDADDSGAENVALDGSGSSDSDGTIVSYSWEENSSQIAAGVNPTVSLSVGAHTIDLIVTDDDSATDTDSVLITVTAANQAPTADAGTDQTVTDTDGNGSASATLDGSGSSDSDGTIVSYVWEEDSSQIATGSSPAVTLAVAVHTIDLTVTDDDSDTDTDSTVVTVVSRTLTSTGSWQNSSLPTQTGACTIEFDMKPNGSSIDTVTAISLGAVAGWNDAACMVRFYTNGEIEARDGSHYASDTTVTYTSGTWCHVRLAIDIANDTYSIYVTPDGQSEITLGTDFSFRTQQIGVGSLNNWALITDSGAHEVKNLTITD